MIFYDSATNSYFVMAQFPTDYGFVWDRVGIVPEREELEVLFKRGDVQILDVKKESTNGSEIHRG